MRNLRPALAVVTLLVLAACSGSSSASGTGHSPSPHASGASPSASGVPGEFPSPAAGVATSLPAAAFSCTSKPAAGQHLALVRLQGVAGIVVRDITDVGRPLSRCTFGGGSYFRFYNATHVSYIVTASGDLGAAGALFLANLATGTTSLVRAWTSGGYASWVYAWSPDGRQLSYLSSDSAGAQWHLLSASGDRMLNNLGPVAQRGRDPNGDDEMVGFSADGQFVAVEQTFTQGSGNTTPPIQVNRTGDGSPAYSRTDGTMAAWGGAGATLYFRTAAGVQSWSPTAGVGSVASGAAWIRPVPSPDGSRMAFSLLNAQKNHVGQVLDLTSGAVHPLSPNPRAGASFLNGSLVWYAGETICTTVTPCAFGVAPLSGKTYIFDLGSEVETGSIDTALYDIWPHVVGQS